MGWRKRTVLYGTGGLSIQKKNGKSLPLSGGRPNDDPGGKPIKDVAIEAKEAIEEDWEWNEDPEKAIESEYHFWTDIPLVETVETVEIVDTPQMATSGFRSTEENVKIRRNPLGSWY